MAWVDALKAYAAKKGVKYHIPKKGTEAYEEVKKLQRGGSGALTKREVGSAVKRLTKAEKMEAGERVRKVRADKGQKRVTLKGIAKETVKQGILPKAEVVAKKMRKERSDKGVKRGSRKPKVEAAAEEELYMA